VIAAGPARSGNVYQGTDADGIMRQHAPLVRHGDRLYRRWRWPRTWSRTPASRRRCATAGWC
jgi:hypothetical protein